MYLTEAALAATLAELGGLAQGTEMVADYMLPAEMRDEDGSTYAEQVAPVAAGRGEPWLTFLSPGEASELLAAHGMEPAEHVHQRDAVDAALWRRSDSLRPIDLSMLARARVI